MTLVAFEEAKCRFDGLLTHGWLARANSRGLMQNFASRESEWSPSFQML
jgi:hypothetical protein